jgi:hypothetical protein
VTFIQNGAHYNKSACRVFSKKSLAGQKSRVFPLQAENFLPESEAPIHRGGFLENMR